MRFADEDGAEIWADERPALTAGAMEMARDVALAHMRARGVPWRMCAVFLNSPEASLRRRLSQIPPEVREVYEQTPLSF